MTLLKYCPPISISIFTAVHGHTHLQLIDFALFSTFFNAYKLIKNRVKNVTLKLQLFEHLSEHLNLNHIWDHSCLYYQQMNLITLFTTNT